MFLLKHGLEIYQYLQRRCSAISAESKETVMNFVRECYINEIMYGEALELRYSGSEEPLENG